MQFPDQDQVLKQLPTGGKQSTEHLVPSAYGRPMEVLLTSAILYIAIGAAFFAHPASPAMPDDFHWRNQIGIFRATLPDVLAWPVALWRLLGESPNRR